MHMKYLSGLLVTAALLIGCSETHPEAEVTELATKQGVDISAAPSGLYKSEPSHSHLNFTYSHHGYSKQTIQWDDMDAVLNLDSAHPEKSSLKVTIPVASIDTGFDPFDTHLLGPDFFDAENHPTITFTSTDMEQLRLGEGKVTGDLTIKGITQPLTLDVTLNKIGKKFRTGEDLFGVSARGQVTRADFGLAKYPPTANVVDLTIDVEFEKVGE